jgi:quercetin dioxygenase-like cupin family protein
MKYIRVYADETGESHYEDVEVELTPRDFSPPAPPLHLSPMTPATGVAFVRFPAGWVGDWHPTPRRQIFFVLAGEVEGETSDGARRRHGPGSAVQLEDTTGKGHRSWVVGDRDMLAAVVQFAD